MTDTKKQTKKIEEIVFYAVVHVSKTLTKEDFVKDFCDKIEDDAVVDALWDRLVAKCKVDKRYGDAEFKCEEMSADEVGLDDDCLDDQIENEVQDVKDEEGVEEDKE